MTDPLGQSQVLTYLTGLSSSQQYRFVIISFEKPSAYSQLKSTIQQICDASNIIWHPLVYTSRPPVISTYRNVQKMKKIARQLQNKHKFSFVHCRSYIPALVGIYLKNAFDLPFIFDMRGFWADERVDGGLWNLKSLIYKTIYNYFKKKEKLFLQQSAQVISLTHAAKNEILTWKMHKPSSPITVIPCCVDFNLFNVKNIQTAEQKSLKESLNIPEDAPVLNYLGSLGTWYMLDEMLQFANKFRWTFNNAYFLILTGEPEQNVMDAATAAGFDANFLRIKKIQRKEVPLYLSICTLGIFFYRPTYSKLATSPVKQGELMAMGIPAVCNNFIGDTKDIIEKYNAGVVLDSFNDEAYDTAIEFIKQANFKKEDIISGAIDYYSLELGVRLYKHVYEKVNP